MDEIDLSEDDARVPVEKTGAPEDEAAADEEGSLPFVHDGEVRFDEADGEAADAGDEADGIDWVGGDEDGRADDAEGPSGDDARRTAAETEKLVEAALFSAGGPVSAEQIAEAAGVDFLRARDALEALVEQYQGRDTAIEVTRAGEKYAMQVRTEMTERARRFAPMEIPRRLLRTLALIAYHQPVKQSDLVDMVGSKTYDHVKQLDETGLIRAKPHGLTKMLSTSEAFPEYFGIDATRPEEIRRFLARKVGIREDLQPAGQGGGVAETAKPAETASGPAAPAGPSGPSSDATGTKAKDEAARKDEGMADADAEEAGNVLNALLG